MKVKYTFIIIAILVISVFISYSFIPVTSHASWADSQENIKQAFDNSDVVLIAKVQTAKSYKLYEAVFTNYKVDVKKTLKGSERFSQDKIEIRLNGGDLGLKKYRLEGQKMLEANETYLLLLKKVWPNNSDSQEYAPIGGFQGVIALSEVEGKWKGKSFNNNNRLEKELKDVNILENVLKVDSQ